jgi:hypothetical protein
MLGLAPGWHKNCIIANNSEDFIAKLSDINKHAIPFNTTKYFGENYSNEFIFKKLDSLLLL